MPSRLDAIMEMTRTRPGDPFVWYALALEYRSAGLAEDAAAAFARLLRDFPDYLPSYLIAGQILVQLGRADEARVVLARGRELAARKGDAHAHGELEALLSSIED